MQTIWKFPLKVVEQQFIRAPRGFFVRHIAAQPAALHGLEGATLTMWAQVDTRNPQLTYEVTLVGTGHPLPDMARHYYAGTAQMPGGLVWHVYLGTYPVEQVVSEQ